MNRRDWSAGAAAFIVFGARTRAAEAGDAIHRTGESIHQEPVFQASRKRVYAALLDARSFDQVQQKGAAMQSGMPLGNKPTVISPQVGGAFTLFGGHIVGRHIELVPNQRIVQAWRVADWSPGVYSIVRFELADNGAGCKIIFDHLAVPDGHAEHLAAGWTQNYWEPLRKFLV